MKLFNAYFNSFDSSKEPAFIVAMNKLQSLDLPVKFSFELLKGINEIEKHIAVFAEANRRLITKHWETNKQGQSSIEPWTPWMGAYLEDLNELCLIENDVDFVQFDRAILLDANVKLSISEIRLLKPMFIETPEEVTEREKREKEAKKVEAPLKEDVIKEEANNK